ncbi:MAG: hypothetical protein KDD50_15350, partial [Bdellovibrionales bacterium]|nr:hypothetical protein [Bdellovibrionales bacterium]
MPFYHNKKDSTPVVALKDWEQRAKDEDWEDIKNQRQHRDREKSQWNRAAFVYNVLQTGTTDDRIANVALGYTRMILDTGIAQMSEGEPDFDFQPIG